MKKRNDRVYLSDVLDAIQRIEEYMRGVSYDAFFDDNLRQDAVVRQLEIIGEACRRISADVQDRYSDIPWVDIIGMRHKIAHDYFKVDLETVWDTILDDLPFLKIEMARILNDLDAATSSKNTSRYDSDDN